MILLVLVGLFLAVNALAFRWGADSRDGRDWASQPSPTPGRPPRR